MVETTRAYVEVPLTRGYVALVDADDAERVINAGPWTARHHRYAWYAQRSIVRDGVATTQSMHQFITGWLIPDHIDGNGLDNRRDNLRESTNAENKRNGRRPKNNTSGYKGVYWHRQAGKWHAQIRVNRRIKSLGLYHVVEDAARAYDAAAREYFGEFACVNFPNDGERGALPGAEATVVRAGVPLPICGVRTKLDGHPCRRTVGRCRWHSAP